MALDAILSTVLIMPDADEEIRVMRRMFEWFEELAKAGINIFFPPAFITFSRQNVLFPQTDQALFVPT